MSDGQSHAVRLAVYDLSGGMARVMSAQLLGQAIDIIPHTGVLVYGEEFFFGGGIQRTSHEAFCQTIRPVEYVDLGSTAVSQERFQEFLREIAPRFSAATYNLFTRNCNHFSDECARFLVGRGIPERITSVPETVLSTPMGQMFAPFIDQMQQSIAGSGSLIPMAAPPQPQQPPQPRQPHAAGPLRPDRAQAERFFRGVGAVDVSGEAGVGAEVSAADVRAAKCFLRDGSAEDAQRSLGTLAAAAASGDAGLRGALAEPLEGLGSLVELCMGGTALGSAEKARRRVSAALLLNLLFAGDAVEGDEAVQIFCAFVVGVGEETDPVVLGRMGLALGRMMSLGDADATAQYRALAEDLELRGLLEAKEDKIEILRMLEGLL